MSFTSRACLACYGLGALFTALSARLVQISVSRHRVYTDLSIHLEKETLKAQRGRILDANGKELALNKPLRDVIIDGSLIKDREKAAALLAEALEMSLPKVLGQICPESKFAVLKKKISETLADTIADTARKAGVNGIHFRENFERIYPAKEMLSHVIGFFGYEDADTHGGDGGFRGIEGIERSMEPWLAGKDGRRIYQRDGRGRAIFHSDSDNCEPVHGANVQLTVDLNLQEIVESELRAACSRLKPLKASVVMMKPDTGEILAMANVPSFDPNEPGKAKPEQRFNNAIAGSFEPGSTFKMITILAGLNARLITLDTEIWCENGRWLYRGKYLHDHHPYGMLPVWQILEKSSNIGAAKIAVQLGDEPLAKAVTDFGFGQRTGIPLPGEARGIVRARRDWSDISITRIAMGHEIAVTPLQLTVATCAIANGGRLMMPQLIREISDPSGKKLVKYEPQEIRRLITPAVAAKFRNALITVTSKKGTASRAHIPGYNVSGKTGTAQKIEDGRYSHEHHVTSFVGFVPAEKPAFCMTVVIDQASVKPSEDTGGLVAAPVFRAIAEKALAYLNIQPDPALIEKEKEKDARSAKAESAAPLIRQKNVWKVASVKAGRN